MKELPHMFFVIPFSKPFKSTKKIPLQDQPFFREHHWGKKTKHLGVKTLNLNSRLSKEIMQR
jgi:hypothetical protein